MSRNMLVTFSVLLSSIICCRAYEVLNSTQMQLEQDSGLKNYEEEEDGKVLPYRCAIPINQFYNHFPLNPRIPFRTFLTTVEIVVICVFTVLFVIFMALLTVYLCLYGCVLPACCR